MKLWALSGNCTNKRRLHLTSLFYPLYSLFCPAFSFLIHLDSSLSHFQSPLNILPCLTHSHNSFKIPHTNFDVIPKSASSGMPLPVQTVTPSVCKVHWERLPWFLVGFPLGTTVPPFSWDSPSSLSREHHLQYSVPQSGIVLLIFTWPLCSC